MVISEWLNRQIRVKYNIEAEFLDDGVGFPRQYSIPGLESLAFGNDWNNWMEALKLSPNQALAVDLR